MAAIRDVKTPTAVSFVCVMKDINLVTTLKRVWTLTSVQHHHVSNDVTTHWGVINAAVIRGLNRVETHAPVLTLMSVKGKQPTALESVEIQLVASNVAVKRRDTKLPMTRFLV